MKRKPLTIRQCRKLLEKQSGLCAVAGCPVVLVLGPKGQHTNFIDEHVQPLSRGGTNALKNRELRCKPHATKKTYHPRSKATTLSGDLFEASKTKRMARKHVVVRGRQKTKIKKHPWVRRPLVGKKGTIQSRGFQKGKRPFRRPK